MERCELSLGKGQSLFPHRNWTRHAVRLENPAFFSLLHCLLCGHHFFLFTVSWVETLFLLICLNLKGLARAPQRVVYKSGDS